MPAHRLWLHHGLSALQAVWLELRGLLYGHAGAAAGDGAGDEWPCRTPADRGGGGLWGGGRAAGGAVWQPSGADDPYRLSAVSIPFRRHVAGQPVSVRGQRGAEPQHHAALCQLSADRPQRPDPQQYLGERAVGTDRLPDDHADPGCGVQTQASLGPQGAAPDAP
ncbi:hypothetical protein AERO8C_120378 [Aeromonas veronii]|uniref:Uncharacterized protein n=1 Tax=Aeromonas veronii TaxID=654 RepID=A0A653KU13_AERVE|nr:hypothetical protein AERO8C_120378 [Aeromonas veronii]